MRTKENKWTQEHIDFVKENYHRIGPKQTAEIIGKTKKSIVAFASRNGLRLDGDIEHKIRAEGKPVQIGELNPNWKGGKKPNIYYKKKSVEKYKDRDKCRNMFYSSIKSGKITRKPCEVCGDQKSEGHHEDYNKPYDVVWLCRLHHVEADKKRRERESS